MENPIRILQVVAQMNMGGLENRIMDIYRNIDRKKVQFDFLIHGKEKGLFDDEIVELGGKIYNIEKITPLTLMGKYQKELEVFFKRYPVYNTVHSHYNALSTFVLRASKKANVPNRISHSRTSSLKFEIKSLVKIYSKIFLKKQCTHFFACSIEAGKWLYGKDIINSEKFKVINNAIETNKYKFNDSRRNQVRDSLGIGDQLIIGHVGSFRYEKNHSFLIDIFNEVHKVKKNVALVLVGDGPLRNEIEQAVIERGLQNNVYFLGMRRDVNELMQAMDYFVFPSHFEGFGTVLVEAQASGLNCLASNKVPPSTNVISTVKYLPLNNKPKLWADIILKDFEHEKDRAIYAEKVAEKGFDIKILAKEMEDFYLGLKEGKK